jgi:uncharacterized membrane protein YkoI
MRKRITVLAVLVVALALAGVGVALGGGTGLIMDDGHPVQPGTLDDGKDLLPLTKIDVSTAVATAQHAANGSLGQVDLKRESGAVVYRVDIGDREVAVDATTGNILAIEAQS